MNGAGEDEEPRESRLARACDAARALLARPATRLVLSGLILVSVLPEPIVEPWRWTFFAIFGTEVLLRAVLLVAPSRLPVSRRRRIAVELPFLVLDTVATLSFLPRELAGGRYLRLVRLLRLVGYWRSFLLDLWTVSWRRERRRQVGFVLAVFLVGTLVGAAVLQVTPIAVDFDDDGAVTAADRDFGTRVWWSFRQMQDPGNLVGAPQHPMLLVLSLGLTLAGLFLLSFLIAVGTTLVEELLVLGRQRRIGLSDHVVVVAEGPHSHFLLEELVRFQGKRLRRQRLVVFGSEASRPEWLESGPLRRLAYRHGDAGDPADLLRADVDRASLVILLAEEAGGDARTVSRVLAVRQLNTRCRIVADVLRARNEVSVREAGGPRTEPVLTRRFVGQLLAHELLFPAVELLLRELLTHHGRELYLVDLPDDAPQPLPAFGELVTRCRAARGVLPLGVRLGRDDAFRVNPPADERVHGASGLLVLARSEREAAASVSEALDDADDGAEAPPSEASVLAPTLRLAEPARVLRRVLVCGHREEVAEAIVGLCAYRPGLETWIMVAPRTVDDVAGSLVRHGAGDFRRADPQASEDGTTLELWRDGEVRGTVRVFAGDPAADADLLTVPEHGHRLDDCDAVLFVADGRWGRDADAKSALGLLRLFALLRGEPGRFRPHFRVVGEVQEPGKGDLLEHRFRPGAGEQVERFSVMPTEKLRHFLLGQAVFVPGIAQVYAELLCEAGEELVKLVPDADGVHGVHGGHGGHGVHGGHGALGEAARVGGELDFDALVHALSRRRILPLAVEMLGDDGTVRVVVNPSASAATAGDDGPRLPRDRVLGVFAVADTTRLET